jgi:hypothetical protein
LAACFGADQSFASDNLHDVGRVRERPEKGSAPHSA